MQKEEYTKPGGALSAAASAPDIFDIPIEADVFAGGPPEEDEEEGHKNHRRRLRRLAFPRPEQLDDVRFLELLLFEAMPRCDTNEIAKDLLERCGGMDRLVACGPDAVEVMDALGESTSVFLQAFFLLCRRYAENMFDDIPEFWELRQVRRWMRNSHWPTSVPVYTALSLDSNLKPVMLRKYTGEWLENPGEFARSIVSDTVTAGSRYLFLTITHPKGVLAPSRSEVNLLLALSDLCLFQATYLSEALIVNEDGAKALSASHLFPIGTFLQFEEEI